PISLYVLLMLPNVAFVWFPRLPFGVQLWSIGVEEQFYLAWPRLLKRSERPLRLLTGIFVAFVVLGFVAVYAKIDWRLRTFILYFQIHCMAAGGIVAALAHRGHEGFL